MKSRCGFQVGRDWPTPQMGQSFGTCTKPVAQGTTPEKLGLVMVVMMVMVMMRSRGKRRRGEYQDQEDSSKDLLHGVNLA
jgi:hypothetical protein